MPPATPKAIIPARFESLRFPGKMLADETGRPLVVHVCDAAARAQHVGQVVVATDDQRIADAVAAAGYDAVLTSSEHPNGTARLAEAAALLQLPDDQVIVNVQGDEPEIDPSVIDAAIDALRDSDADVSTIASPIRDEAEAADPNVVKVVVDRAGRALYFSRARIPHDRDHTRAPEKLALRHVGLYCYSAAFLRRYASLPETPLERAERLEQLRVLEHHHSIAVDIRETSHTGIDTLEQYRAFVRRHAPIARGT